MFLFDSAVLCTFCIVVGGEVSFYDPRVASVSSGRIRVRCEFVDYFIQDRGGKVPRRWKCGVG